MRPAYISEAPQFFPHVCIMCGLGGGDNRREFFVDLGIEINTVFQPIQEGNLILCNECMRNKIEEVQSLMNQWDYEHRSYDGHNVQEATYAWKNDIDLSSLEVEDGPGTVDSDTAGVDSGAEQDDSGSQPVLNFDEPESPLNVSLGFGSTS